MFVFIYLFLLFFYNWTKNSQPFSHHIFYLHFILNGLKYIPCDHKCTNFLNNRWLSSCEKVPVASDAVTFAQIMSNESRWWPLCLHSVWQCWHWRFLSWLCRLSHSFIWTMHLGCSISYTLTQLLLSNFTFCRPCSAEEVRILKCFVLLF